MTLIRCIAVVLTVAFMSGLHAEHPDGLQGTSLTVFDVVNKRVNRTIDLSDYPRPHGILLLPSEEEVITLFLALAGRDQVMVIDIESRGILDHYPTGSAPDGIGYSPLQLR
ncbi:MAG: hypothetical protein KJN90_13490 [Gammaproteobacteria bacterium]|nr:hypothetical protein [Gammaproteobacteria bacterium]